MKEPRFPPKAWPKFVRSAALHAASLAHWSLIQSRSWCADSPIRQVRLAGKMDQAESETRLLREELRIEDDSLVRTPAPLNKFSEFVRHIVRKLNVLCPAMGKRRIAESLAKAGIQLAATEVVPPFAETPVFVKYGGSGSVPTVCPSGFSAESKVKT